MGVDTESVESSETTETSIEDQVAARISQADDSEEDSAEAILNDSDEDSEEETVETEETTDETDGAEEEESEEPEFERDELAPDFLKGIEDEELKERLKPYVKKWDAGVTRRFQDIRAEAKPYQELGSVEELQQAKQVFELLQSDPKQVYDILHEQFGGGGGTQRSEQARGTQQGEMSNDDAYAVLEEINPAVAERFRKMEQMVTQVTEQYLNQQKQGNQAQEQEAQAAKEAEEDAQLENYLKLLHQEHGDFDDEFVISQVAYQDMSWEDAIDKYNSLIENQVQQRISNQPAPPPKAPKLLGGTGGSPQPGNDVRMGDLSDNEIKDTVAKLMQQQG